MKKQQVPKYYAVKHIKTGRIFQAEYDSKSAAFYEKGTGMEYDITEVTFIRNNSLSAQMNREQKLKQAAKKVTNSPENARKFLQSAGIMTKDGKLHHRYK